LIVDLLDMHDAGMAQDTSPRPALHTLAALAARHGRALEPDDPLAAGPLQRLTRNTGWRLTTYDDAVHRFLAIAARE
jgi:hypothetical protein